MELAQELKPEIVLKDRKVIIKVGEVATLEVGIIELLEAITTATPTSSDDALLATLKPVLKTVLDALGK